MKEKRLFMNLKKKLAVFMSLGNILNIAPIKDVNAMGSNTNRSYNSLEEKFYLEPMDLWSEILKIDPANVYIASIILLLSIGRKTYDNSIVVPKSLPKDKNSVEPIVPLPNKVENQIEWPNSMSWKDLVKKSQDLWEQQGYSFNRVDNPQHIVIKAMLKSDGNVYNQPFHVPQGILGPIYAVDQKKIKQKCNDNKNEVERNIDSLKNGKVPLCDCDGLLVNSKTELMQILTIQLMDLQNYMNKEHQIKNIKNGAAQSKALSLGDILYMFNKLVQRLTDDGNKSPITTVSWFFLGGMKANGKLSLDQGLLDAMQLISNVIPVLGLYGIPVPGRYDAGKFADAPVLGNVIEFYNKQCKWDFAVPIRSEENAGTVLYQIGNTVVKLEKNSKNVHYPLGMNFDGLKVINTDLSGNGYINGLLVGAANKAMNYKNILGMNNLKDFVAVFTTRLAFYIYRLEPLIKVIECLDDTYQQGKPSIESLIKNVETLIGKNESIETAKQIIKEYSPESEKGKILRQLLDLFKRNFDDSTLDNMLQNVNYFKEDLPTVFEDYDEKGIEKKENDYINELNEKKSKLPKLPELVSKLNNDNSLQEQYDTYAQIAKICVDKGQIDKKFLEYINRKYIGGQWYGTDYLSAINAIKRLLMRCWNTYHWKELEFIESQYNSDAELQKLKSEIESSNGKNDVNEYKALDKLAEFCILDLLEPETLENLEFITKKYIGLNLYNSNYLGAVRAIMRLLIRRGSPDKWTGLELIKNKYDKNSADDELKKLNQNVDDSKTWGGRYKYEALQKLAEFYIEEGLLTPNILADADNKINKEYIIYYDYSEAIKFLQDELNEVKY